MKRVTTKITDTGEGSWRFVVQVDGEEFARGTCRDYLGTLDTAWAYARSLHREASTSSPGVNRG